MPDMLDANACGRGLKNIETTIFSGYLNSYAQRSLSVRCRAWRALTAGWPFMKKMLVSESSKSIKNGFNGIPLGRDAWRCRRFSPRAKDSR